MTEAAKFFNDFGDLLLQKVEMNFIAQIISFNSGEYRATIRPLLFTNNESGNGQVVNVPDIYNVPVERVRGIKHQYKKGDLVTVKLFASSIQQPLDGTRANMRENRFQFSNCVISGAVKLKDPEPDLIEIDDESVKVSGTLAVTGDIVLNGQSLKDFLTLEYPMHVHTGVTPGSGSSGPVGP